jgi:hypothetical protein
MPAIAWAAQDRAADGNMEPSDHARLKKIKYDNSHHVALTAKLTVKIP